jgi:hypothetical protein
MKPDVGLGNFSVAELCAVLIMVARQHGNGSVSEEDFLLKIGNVDSNKELFLRASRAFPDSRNLYKSEEWGTALMRFAIANPVPAGGATRPLITAAQRILRATQIKYNLSRKRFRVDPNTGDVIERK